MCKSNVISNGGATNPLPASDDGGTQASLPNKQVDTNIQGLKATRILQGRAFDPNVIADKTPVYDEYDFTPLNLEAWNQWYDESAQASFHPDSNQPLNEAAWKEVNNNPAPLFNKLNNQPLNDAAWKEVNEDSSPSFNTQTGQPLNEAAWKEVNEDSGPRFNAMSSQPLNDAAWAIVKEDSDPRFNAESGHPLNDAAWRECLDDEMPRYSYSWATLLPLNGAARIQDAEEKAFFSGGSSCKNEGSTKYVKGKNIPEEARASKYYDTPKPQLNEPLNFAAKIVDAAKKAKFSQVESITINDREHGKPLNDEAKLTQAIYEAIFDPETGRPVNEYAQYICDQSDEPLLDMTTGEPINKVARAHRDRDQEGTKTVGLGGGVVAAPATNVASAAATAASGVAAASAIQRVYRGQQAKRSSLDTAANVVTAAAAAGVAVTPAMEVSPGTGVVSTPGSVQVEADSTDSEDGIEGFNPVVASEDFVRNQAVSDLSKEDLVFQKVSLVPPQSLQATRPSTMKSQATRTSLERGAMHSYAMLKEYLDFKGNNYTFFQKNILKTGLSASMKPEEHRNQLKTNIDTFMQNSLLNTVLTSKTKDPLKKRDLFSMQKLIESKEREEADNAQMNVLSMEDQLLLRASGRATTENGAQANTYSFGVGKSGWTREGQ